MPFRFQPSGIAILVSLFSLALGCQRFASNASNSPSQSLAQQAETGASPWFIDITEQSGLNFVHDAGPLGNYFMLFREATQSKPSFAAAQYDLGQCLLHRGDRSGAMAAFRKAVRCKHDYADAHTMLSKLLAEDGRHAEASAHARLALQFHPADMTAKKLVQQLLIHIPFSSGL